MSRFIESKKVYAMMCFLFAFSVLAISVSGGSMPSFGAGAVLGPDAPQQLADSPFGGPDPFEREGVMVADSPFGGPDPFEREGRADSPFGGPDPFEREGLILTDSPFGGPDPFEREGRI